MEKYYKKRLFDTRQRNIFLSLVLCFTGYGVSKVVSPYGVGVTPAVYGGYGYGHGLAAGYGHGLGMI